MGQLFKKYTFWICFISTLLVVFYYIFPTIANKLNTTSCCNIKLQCLVKYAFNNRVFV
jgi:hypothetical protein